MLRDLTEGIIHGNPPVILTPALLVTAWFIRAAIQQRVRVALIVCGAVEVLIGMALAGLMATHILGSMVRRVRLKEEMWVRFEPHVRFAGVPYDFRLYSLVLFAVLGFWAGVSYVRAGRRMTLGDAGRWRSAAWTSVALVALVAPLLPLQSLFTMPVLAMTAREPVARAGQRRSESRDCPRSPTA
jgi:hypothetical protein